MDYQQNLKERIKETLNHLDDESRNLEQSIKLSEAEGIDYPSRSNFRMDFHYTMQKAVTLMRLYNEQFGDDEDIIIHTKVRGLLVFWMLKIAFLHRLKSVVSCIGNLDMKKDLKQIFSEATSHINP
ncbi:hypothetical protein J4225_04330 [Candidatus Pacearchaeota archaeon]|nr:hypothetical protein [Candidatus Pacearchaeota archaeon]